MSDRNRLSSEASGTTPDTAWKLALYMELGRQRFAHGRDQRLGFLEFFQQLLIAF